MEYLEKYRKTLQVCLDNFISSKKKDDADSIWVNDFLQRLEIFVRGGKHIRGGLVCYTYGVCSGKKPDNKIFNAAAAIELMHAGLLIQDDIIDQDDKRRGRPSMHYQYRQIGLKLGFSNASHFGEAMAICASDLAMFFAFELLAKSTSSLKTVNKLHKSFIDSLVEVSEGQMQDIYFESSSEMPSKETLIDLMRLKTASYSMALPMVMGAILAGSAKNIQSAFRSLGVDIGVIFQIRDDELGALGDPKSLGKPVGADIREGKKTLLYYYLQKKCSKHEWAKLDSIFGNASAAPNDIKQIQSAMAKHKIPLLLAQDVAKLQKLAYQKIDKLSFEAEIKDELKSFVRFCATRKI